MMDAFPLGGAPQAPLAPAISEPQASRETGGTKLLRRPGFPESGMPSHPALLAKGPRCAAAPSPANQSCFQVSAFGARGLTGVSRDSGSLCFVEANGLVGAGA